MSKASPEIAQIGNITDLFVTELQNVVNNETSTPVDTVDPTDRANLITKVYTGFGIFTPETAEQAPELLVSQIEQLIQSNPGTELEPFVVVNLSRQFGRPALISAFDQKQDSSARTYVRNDLWDQYDLANINRRTVDGGQESQLGDVRAQILTKSENSYQESGLQATNKNLDVQKEFARAKILLNLTDYVLIQALRREEDYQLMDTNTFTRFVQMDKKNMGDSCVGGASVIGGQLELVRSYVRANDSDGVRLSVGQTEDLNS